MPSAISRAIVIVVFALIAGPWPATARTLAVPDAYPTIGAALAEAAAGDFVLVSCGVYRERNLRVPPGVSLWSATLQPDCAVIDAEGRGRVLEFVGCDSTTAVVGLTLRGGRADGLGGLILCRDAAPRLSRCRLERGRADRGGGLACTGDRGPTLTDCEIVGNAAGDRGGGVFWAAEAAGRLTRCVLADNTALGVGGGLAVVTAADLRLEACRAIGNAAGVTGGGIWLGAGRLDLRDCVLARNAGGLGGGAVACGAARVEMLGCTLAENLADQGGAALYLHEGALAARRTLVAFNQPAALAGEPTIPPQVQQSNVYGHATGDWAGSLAPLAVRPDNFSADPLFCERGMGLYDVRAGSPCLPGNRPDGAPVRIGARGQGCD